MKGGFNVTPRTGRPKTENPRTERISFTLTKEDMENVQEARNKDKQPDKTLSTWVARKVAEMAKKIVTKK